VAVTPPRRYVVLAEGSFDEEAKTATGVMRYAESPTVAVIDSTRAGTSASDHVPGMRSDVPVVADIDAAMAHGPTTMLVGVAPAGGKLPPVFRRSILRAIELGLDVESGLHEFLTEDAEIADAAALAGVSLRDLRRVPDGLNVPTGANLDIATHTVLTVGSDCALGKMTVCLELDREARSRGIASEFVPTGQTGIAIAGWGIAVDAVVSDFIAGAAERLVVEGAERGGELLLVEGQGSLLHPAYSGVTLGLIHGSAPHAYVLCHQAGQRYVDDDERFPIPPLSELIDLHERMSLLARPARVAAIALNTRNLDEDAARAAVEEAEAETGLPADDPVRFGAARLVDALALLAPR
jgi:uncharacterized NAD-dependent epimerase/dehydratase family protein